jgi:hypothetical protein
LAQAIRAASTLIAAFLSFVIRERIFIKGDWNNGKNYCY